MLAFSLIYSVWDVDTMKSTLMSIAIPYIFRPNSAISQMSKAVPRVTSAALSDRPRSHITPAQVESRRSSVQSVGGDSAKGQRSKSAASRRSSMASDISEKGEKVFTFNTRVWHLSSAIKYRRQNQQEQLSKMIQCQGLNAGTEPIVAEDQQNHTTSVSPETSRPNSGARTLSIKLHWHWCYNMLRNFRGEKANSQLELWAIQQKHFKGKRHSDNNKKKIFRKSEIHYN